MSPEDALRAEVADLRAQLADLKDQATSLKETKRILRKKAAADELIENASMCALIGGPLSLAG